MDNIINNVISPVYGLGLVESYIKEQPANHAGIGSHSADDGGRFWFCDMIVEL